MKHLILVILLVCPATIFAQVKTKTNKGKIVVVDETKPEVPKIQNEKNAPQIVLTNPLVTQGQIFKTDKDFITIAGKITDESQIKLFLMNNLPQVLSEKSEFSISQTLSEGKNNFQFSAEDIYGNISSFSFTVDCSPDKQAPLIQLLSPVAANGGNLTVKDKKFVISGTVTDNDGVAFVEINSKRQYIDSKNGFTISFDLMPGINSFVVTSADNKKNVSSYSFIVNFLGDISGPVLTVIQPNIASENTIFTKDAMLAVIGAASDESGVKSFLVNGQKARFIEGGQYYSNIILSPGANIVTIEATDSLNNKSTLSFNATFVTDTKPPVVSILEPPASRGLKPVSKKEVITLKGIAVDESGVRSVEINNRPAPLEATGNFSLDVNLIIGDNQFVISALDNNGNKSLDTITINRKLDELITTGKYYALIIGIDDYSGVWPKLKNAVNDAKAVATLLKDEYNFTDIVTLYNKQASRLNIISEIEKLIATVEKNDNVLIYYSGHGELINKLNKGFWVPADATTNSTAGYISNNDVQTFISGINSKHTLLVSDACFGGDIFRGRTSELEFENSEKYFKEVYRRASRYALTSGGIEPVTDGGKDGHSIFTFHFLKTLKENTAKYFTAGQLFNELLIPVANNSEQSPNYQPIKNTGDEGGQFIFIKK